MAKTEFGIAVPEWIANPQRFLDIRSRLDQIALEEAGQPQHAAGSRSFRRSPPVFGVAYESRRRLSRQPVLAAHTAAGPLPIIGGKSLGGTVDACGEFLRAGKRGSRLRRGIAPTPSQCFAVAGL